VTPHIRTLAVVAVAALLAAGCSRGGSSSESTPTQSAQAVSGDFGTLKDVCRPGKPTSSPTQGVTADQIKVGVLTDIGFTKVPDLVNTAKVFSSWCNAAGGINGRKIVIDLGDTQLMQSVQAMAGACGKDFVLAGNSEALDGLAVKTRVSCLLPEFPAQIVMPQNVNSALQAYPLVDGHSYSIYQGYFNWLLKEAYPDSAKHVGILYGQSAITAPTVKAEVASLTYAGATMAYNGAFPTAGVTDWTPFAQAIKSKGVKGLVFSGTPQWLASLEQVLTNMNYKLDWIDANPNSYGAPFISLAGKSLSYQHNYAELFGTYPMEKASGNPAAERLAQLFKTYAPGQSVSLQGLQAWSAWLLFAKAAASCGDNLTRKCAYQAALTQTAWTGGGLQAPVNLSKPDSPVDCFNAAEATPTGWQPARFGANNGAYRCGSPVFKLPAGIFPPPLTLADVGKSMSDVK
jgi:ABC-type branched-subunit amino acid transport system substrate-binding protein